MRVNNKPVRTHQDVAAAVKGRSSVGFHFRHDVVRTPEKKEKKLEIRKTSH